jgi:hypothetical protein
VTPPLPRDAFPQRIETERLCLRRPERREVALYARQAAEAYVTRTQPLSEERASAFAAFMIERCGSLRMAGKRSMSSASFFFAVPRVRA